MVGLVGLIGLLAVAPSAQAPTIAITDVTLIDGGDGPVRPGMTVVVRGGTIAEIAPSAAARVPSGAMRVDGRGRYLIPGLIDAHVHLATRPDVTPELVLPALVAHGVLAVRDMGGDLDRVLAMRRKVEASELAGPAIVTPGPFLDGAQQATPGAGGPPAPRRRPPASPRARRRPPPPPQFVRWLLARWIS